MSKHEVRPVWQVGQSGLTRISSVSASQSVVMEINCSVLPEVSPFRQRRFFVRLKKGDVSRPSCFEQRLFVHISEHQHPRGAGVLDYRGQQAVERLFDRLPHDFIEVFDAPSLRQS